MFNNVGCDSISQDNNWFEEIYTFIDVAAYSKNGNIPDVHRGRSCLMPSDFTQRGEGQILDSIRSM
jgi:hypothetical protein